MRKSATVWAILTVAAVCQGGDVMGKGYRKLWDETQNAAIDKRIERFRKTDVEVGGFAPGTEVRADQMASAFQFGANLFNFEQLGKDEYNAAYKAFFTNVLNAATIPFYWKTFEPKPGMNRFLAGEHDTAAFWNSCANPTEQLEWRRPSPDPLIQFCEANGIAMHGHVILYPPYGPAWLPKERSAELQMLFEKRVTDICSYYKGRIPQWDVVNESVNRSCTAAAPNDDICWENKSIAVPKDYTLAAYKQAAELFPPSVKLVINDSWRPIYPPFVRSLLQRGAKIDVVGIQMHIFTAKECARIANGEPCLANGTSWEPMAQTAMFRALDELQRPIHVSEITIPSPEPTPRGDAIQAQMLRDNYRLWFSWPSVYRITYWNPVDSVGGEILRSGFFTRDMKRKAACDALEQLILHEWRTHVTLTADSKGVIRFRGFKGRYLLTWKDPDGKDSSRTVTTVGETPAAPPEFPFVISYSGATNATSMAEFLDAPAGGHGFVRVNGNHFETDAGPIRFNATGLTGPACFPARETSDRLAARLSRLGVNCVRLHFMDTWYQNFMTNRVQGILADDTRTQRKLDTAQLDKLDYLVAALKKRGIYVNMNTHVGRTLDARDGCPDGSPWANKTVGHFMPRMTELQREYTRDLLTHVNTYTGNAYKDEPSVAMIEISNEDESLNRIWKNGSMERWPAPFRDELARQWNAWLHKKYADRRALRDTWTLTQEPLRDEQIGTAWRFEKGGAKAEMAARDGGLRVHVAEASAQAFFPKAFHPVALKKGQVYTFAMKARRGKGAGEGIVSCAVATTQGGWRQLGWSEVITVTEAEQMFTRSFEATEDCPAAFVQLTRFQVGMTELDGISFQSGAPKPDRDITEGFETGTVPLPFAKAGLSAAAKRDFDTFLTEKEISYYDGMTAFIHNEVKARQPVSGTQVGWYSPCEVQARLDYVDNHAYWHHPHGQGTAGWIVVGCTNDWVGGGASMVNSLGCLRGLAESRVASKPYTVSEYSHPYPNPFVGEGQPMACAVARLLDWDGIFQYSYNHYPDAFEPNAMPWCNFDGLATPSILAQFPISWALLTRGDLRPEPDARIFETKPGEVFTSTSGQFVWNREIPQRAYLAVDTQNSKLFTGFPEDRTVELGNVSLAIGWTRFGWATVSLVSRTATGFGERGAASILAVATGDCGNTGRIIQHASETEARLLDRGHAPVEAEGIPAELVLPADARRVSCWALDPDGNRMAEIPATAAGNGRARLSLSPAYRTVWYEISVR